MKLYEESTKEFILKYKENKTQNNLLNKRFKKFLNNNFPTLIEITIDLKLEKSP